MLVHLDQQELEAVVCHELAHISAQDMLLIWIGTILRDAFFYIPMSHIAYRQFLLEKELLSSVSKLFTIQNLTTRE